MNRVSMEKNYSNQVGKEQMQKQGWQLPGLSESIIKEPLTFSDNLFLVDIKCSLVSFM